jgi:PAS domain-containing protein
VVKADGRWVQVNDRRSTEGGIASIYTDITDVKDAERQEREKALAERSAHLQATLESMSIGVAVFDRDQHLVTANRRYGELLELPAELRRAGASYRRFQEFTDARGAPALGTASPIGPGSARGSGPPAEVALNGRWFEVKGDPMPDGGFVTSYVEITERKMAEEALLDSEQRIRLFANAVPTMISYVDRDQRYRFVNRGAPRSWARRCARCWARPNTARANPSSSAPWPEPPSPSTCRCRGPATRPASASPPMCRTATTATRSSASSP